MKPKNDRNYNFQSKNIHFKNILEKSYYIELGVIDMKIMDRFLKGEKIELKDVVDMNILSSGVGMITGDITNDFYYQLNYLINLRLKNSTFKFILTAGMLKYYDENKCEKYAPLVLIPFDFDYQHFEIIKSESPYFNPLLLKYLANDVQKKEEIKRRMDNNITLDDRELELEENKDKKGKLEDILKKVEEEKRKFIDDFSNRKINTASDIDRLGLDLIKITNTTVDPSNFFTIAYVEYPDIILNNYNMSTERSIYEMSEYQLTKRYFNEIKGILPTNIDQKYVCLKVNEGEKFSVDGRLGSGKTYTIINIIADQISKGKKILYANQDLDNIFDLEKNMTYLGLSDYIYNLTKNIRDIEKVDLVFEQENSKQLSKDCFDEMYIRLNHYQKRIHGYPIANMIEELAILKKENPDIKAIDLETVLESHEVKYIYNQLKSIEESLKVIDLYANNIWHRLHTAYNNISEEDIIHRVIELQHCNNEFYDELKKYAKTYNLIVPKSVNDFFKLSSHIYHFASIKPLPSWKSEDVRREVLKHVREIQSCSDINYTLMNFYKENIHSNYHQGRMFDILNELIGNHITISDTLETTDKLFINRLIDFSDNLTAFSKQVDHSIQTISKNIEDLKDVFEIKNITNESCTFFNNLNHFLDNNRLNQMIIHTYLEQTALFSKNGEIIYHSYQNYLEQKEFLPKYVSKFELLTINFLDNIYNRNNANNILARYVNKKISKRDHKEVKEIVESLKIYYHSMCTIQTNLKELFGNNEYDMEFIEQFNHFFFYVNHLTTKQTNSFKIFLKKYQSHHYHTSYINGIIQLLLSFKEEGYHITSFSAHLKNYNIHIHTEDIVEKISQLKSWNAYLRKVDQFKTEIREIFIKNNKVEYEDMKELIENDNKYIKLHRKLEENANLYASTIGKYYYGLDTAINDITQTIEHYGEFLKCIHKQCNVDDLFTEEKFNTFLDDTKYIDSIYTNWISYFRAFSICFKAGQPELQYNSFDFNIKLFRQFIEKQSQVSPILNINRITDEFLNYGLRELHDGIRSCKYGIGISKQFMYSVLMGYYNEIQNTESELFDPSPIKELLNNYVEYEYQCCQNNREVLVNHAEKIEKNGYPIHTSKFNDYNTIVRDLIKSIPVFLTDLDILNSNLDLSLFDLIIIDDAHLSSANKYRRIVEAKQVVVFGDILFQTSVSNALMKRLGEACTVHFKRRYVQMNSRFHNQWDYNNQYIYSYDNRCNVVQLEQFSDFVEEIFKRYRKFHSHIINILVGNEETRRLVYTSIVNRLATEYTINEITTILRQNIRILNALTEGNRYVNDVFIYFDDIKELEPSLQELIFKNFISVHNSVVIYYVKNRIESKNTEVIKKINKLIGKNNPFEKTAEGITKILIDTLREKGLAIDLGFGMFDFIVCFKKPIAVMIVGKKLDQLSSIYDDYLYYHNEYEKRGWLVEVFYVLDLFKDFDKCVKQIIDLGSIGK